MHRFWCCGLMLALMGLLPAGAAPDEKPKTSGEVVIAGIDGKETKLAAAKFTPTGTRRLAWLADSKATTPEDKLGPLAVKIREQESTTLVDGVLTLIPAASLEAAKYDYEKLTVSLSFKGRKDPIAGTLQYKGLNTLGVSGTVEGKTTTLTAGVPGKAAVKSMTFPDARPLPPGKTGGLEWDVQIIQKEPANPKLRVWNLKVLYHFPDGSERLTNELPVRKGTPVLLDDKLTRLEMLATDPNTNFAAAEVEVQGTPEKLVVIPLTIGQEKKTTGTVVGLLGEIDVGYKLFPLHTIKAVSLAVKKTD